MAYEVPVRLITSGCASVGEDTITRRLGWSEDKISSEITKWLGKFIHVLPPEPPHEWEPWACGTELVWPLADRSIEAYFGRPANEVIAVAGARPCVCQHMIEID